MSMLAERRSRKKWCLNPNGKDWSNDDNKFGQRMLEKMGWKKGCGLGVNLQGMKEHVRVSAKNDTKGLGCKKNSDTEWIHHQQNFESLLSELACTTYEEIRQPGPSETKPVSLEEKSKKSRVRVHYQKFTRGKDVSQYSANDLACIFGKKCNSQDIKSCETQYSCRINTRNISEVDSEVGMISHEHKVAQGSNLCEEKTSDVNLPLLLPKHRSKDQPAYYSPADKSVQEKQNYILKEISNVKENSVPVMDVAQERKSEMEDNSASHSWSESVEKIRIKKKRKRVKDSENNEELFTGSMISICQQELIECDSVVHKVEEMDEVEEEEEEEEKKKRRKKKKKDKKIKSKEEDEKEDNVIFIEELIYITSDAEETRDEVTENASVTNEADTRDSKIKMKEVGKLYETRISEEHEEPPEMKKKKKKKHKKPFKKLHRKDVEIGFRGSNLNSISGYGSEIVSSLPTDNKSGINNTQRSTSFSREPFSPRKEEPHLYDGNSDLKHRKPTKKLHRKVWK